MFAEALTGSNKSAYIWNLLNSQAGVLAGTVSTEVLECTSGDFEAELVVNDSEEATVIDPPVKRTSINDLYDEGYKILRPIPIEIERIDDGEALAQFEEANIAISGTNEQDAFQSLFAEILDTFDRLLDEENNLGPDAATQLKVLRSYIAKA